VAFRPAVLSYDDLRRLAEEFLEEFHEERTLPVPIEEIVEFDFELEIVPMEGILDDLEVDAFLTSDLKQIYVDAFVLKHRYRRFRFSLAHELVITNSTGPSTKGPESDPSATGRQFRILSARTTTLGSSSRLTALQASSSCLPRNWQTSIGQLFALLRKQVCQMRL
jgi:hypothetical protein